jgi:hypothetical protein
MRVDFGFDSNSLRRKMGDEIINQTSLESIIVAESQAEASKLLHDGNAID